MANKPDFQMTPQKTTPLREILYHLKLVWNLVIDRRVNFLLKIIPFTGVVYTIFPLDFDSLIIAGWIDDFGVLWFTQYLFIELCPENVVAEIRARLFGVPQSSSAGSAAQDHSEIIDAEFKDVEES